jgi:hypothetical protein
MTETLPTLTNGDAYVVLYTGGPNDGQTDSRIITDTTFDQEITVLTAVDGKETMIDYTLTSFKEVGGSYQVTYAFDAKDSEPIADPEDRGDRQ